MNFREKKSINSRKIYESKFLSFQLAPECRLGNNLFELSSLLGVAQFLNRTPVIYVTNPLFEKMIRDSNDTMPGLIKQILVTNETMPEESHRVFFNTRSGVYQDPRILVDFHDQHLHVQGQWYQSFKYFSSLHDTLRGYMRNVTSFNDLPIKNDQNFIICAHTRRGDFQSHNFAMTNERFLNKSLEYVEKRKKSNRITNFVLFGDSLKFMKGIFNDTVVSNEKTSPSHHFISQNSPTEDLIYAKDNCDAVLISAAHSTFGWWMGYLSRGGKVYYQDIRMTKDAVYKSGRLHPADYYPPEWIALRMADNDTVVESY